MPAFRDATGQLVIEDTRPLTDAEAEIADLRAQIDADPSLKEAREHFPSVVEAVTAGDWDAAERAIVREIVSYMSNTTAETDLALSGLFEWGTGAPNDPAYIHDLTWIERQQYVGMGHRLAKASPPVHNALRLGTSYVIGQGIPMPTSADADVQAVIADIWDDPDNAEFCTHEGQKETDREQRLQGEIFVAVYVGADGHCKFRSVDALRVKNVVPHPEDGKRALYYEVQIQSNRYNFASGTLEPTTTTDTTVYFPDWRNIAPPDASDEVDRDPYRGTVPTRAPGGAVMAHFPLNRLGGMRGIPDMAAAVVWVVEHKRFMDARIMIMQALAKISMIKTVKGGPAAVSNAAATERSSLSQLPWTMWETNPMPAPGSVYAKNEGIDVEFPTFDTGAANATKDLEALAQMIGTAFGLPTHYILMSTETHRLATAVAMELPVLKMYEDRQSAWRDMLRALFDYALLQAAKAGRLAAPVLYRHGHEMIDWDSADPAPDRGRLDGTPITAPDAATSPVREARSDGDEGPVPAKPTPAPVMPAVITGQKRDDAHKEQITKTRGQYDISLPLILQRDVQAQITAIDVAAKGGYITQEQAARQAYAAFSYDDVDDALSSWRVAVDERLEQHATAQDQEDEERQQRLEAMQAHTKPGAGAPPTPKAKTPRTTAGAEVPSQGMSADQ